MDAARPTPSRAGRRLTGSTRIHQPSPFLCRCRACEVATTPPLPGAQPPPRLLHTSTCILVPLLPPTPQPASPLPAPRLPPHPSRPRALPMPSQELAVECTARSVPGGGLGVPCGSSWSHFRPSTRFTVFFLRGLTFHACPPDEAAGRSRSGGEVWPRPTASRTATDDLMNE